MSAYLVEDKTINIAITVLRNLVRNDLRWTGEKFKEAGYDLETIEGCETLGQEMFILNINGVDTRYGTGEAKGFRNLNYKFNFESGYTLIQGYKKLAGFLYQCNEGENDKDKLFKLLDETKSTIAEYIVARLPEYDLAAWA